MLLDTLSDTVSLLTTYCQKNNLDLPCWSFAVKTVIGEPITSISLKLANDEFIYQGPANRQNAKRLLAGKAIGYLTDNGCSFFKNNRNHVGILLQICQLAKIATPDYDCSSSPDGFVAVVSVNGSDYSGAPASKKSSAKENAALVACSALVDIPRYRDLLHQKSYLALADNVQHRKITMQDSLIAPPPAETDIPTFSSVISKLLERNPKFGSPQFNYRLQTDSSGKQMHRCQLIVKDLVFITPDAYPSQNDATQEACKMAFEPLYEQLSEQEKEFIANYAKVNNTKRKLEKDEENQMFFSDDEEIPSYQFYLTMFCVERKYPAPVFTYLRGDRGVRCRVSVTVDEQEISATCLRDHKYKSHAREDSCHDMYIIMKKFQ